MIEQEWLDCLDPRWMLEHLRKNARSRKLRLFACACARRAWSRITSPICREAVELAERIADKQAKNAEREKVNQTVRALCRRNGADGRRERADEVSVAYHVSRGSRYTHVDAGIAAQKAVFAVTGVEHRDDNPEAEDGERAAQSELFRDIYGNPFRSVTIDQSWLAWNDGAVRKLAQGIYDERELPSGHLDPGRLAILADALEDAGCASEDVLSHCRQPGAHVRGCWVVDLILGKE